MPFSNFWLWKNRPALVVRTSGTLQKHWSLVPFPELTRDASLWIMRHCTIHQTGTYRRHKKATGGGGASSRRDDSGRCPQHQWPSPNGDSARQRKKAEGQEVERQKGGEGRGRVVRRWSRPGRIFPFPAAGSTGDWCRHRGPVFRRAAEAPQPPLIGRRGGPRRDLCRTGNGSVVVAARLSECLCF